MLWRFIKVILAAVIVFIVFNFLLSNLDSKTLGYPIHFQFSIPPFWYFESVGFPVGILILIAFCLGMVFAAFIGAISVFYRSRELKAKNRTIRELEREIDELRTLYSTHRQGFLSSPSEASSFSKNDSSPDEPRIE